jgi:hypothetical protein
MKSIVGEVIGQGTRKLANTSEKLTRYRECSVSS